MISHLEFMLFGAMIVFFLIVEPHGLGPAVGDRQGEAAAMAVPVLSVQAIWSIGSASTQD